MLRLLRVIGVVKVQSLLQRGLVEDCPVRAEVQVSLQKRGVDEDFPVRMDIQVSLQRGLDGDYPVCKVALARAAEVCNVGLVRYSLSKCYLTKW